MSTSPNIYHDVIVRGALLSKKKGIFAGLKFEAMGELNVYPGEVIEILNPKNNITILATVRKLKKKEHRTYFEPNVLLANFPLINQIGCTIGDNVKIRKINCEFARSITVSVLDIDLSGAWISIPIDKNASNKPIKNINPKTEEWAAQMLKDKIIQKLSYKILRKTDKISFKSYGTRVDLKILDFSPNAEAVKVWPHTEIQVVKKKRKRESTSTNSTI